VIEYHKLNTEKIMLYNVCDYGANPKSKEVQTKYFQNAIDDCSCNGGGVVFVPKGEYTLGGVVVKSAVTVQFEDGTIIYGADLEHFEKDEYVPYPWYQDLSHTTYNVSLFRCDGATDITFKGNATIDMREVWDEDCSRHEKSSGRGAKVFAFKNAKNVTIDGLKMINSTDLTIYVAGCENVKLVNLDIDTHIDGINIDGCTNSYVGNCKILAGDDCIAVKTSYTLGYKSFTKDLLVENCSLTSRCAALKIGTETGGDFSNVVFRNCYVYDTRLEAVALEIADGGIMDGVVVDNIKMKNVNVPLMIMLTDRKTKHPEGTPAGKIRNIKISNIEATGPYLPFTTRAHTLENFFLKDYHIEPWHKEGVKTDGQMPEYLPWQNSSSITGIEGNCIENVTLENVKIVARGGGREEHRDIKVPTKRDIKPSTKLLGEIQPSSILYCRHVKGLKLINVECQTELEDKREKFVFEDVTLI
jgi:polygalacturonase